MENKSSLGRFIKSSIIFFVGTVLSKLISVVMLPLYTSYIPTDDMGYYDLSLTYVTIATSLLFIDIWVAILRYMYDGGDNSEDKKASIIKSGFVIFLVSSGLYLAVAGCIAAFFEVKGILWITLYGLTHNLCTLFAYCTRGYGKNMDFSISGIINTCTNILCNIICIVYLSMGFEALYISGIIGYLAQVIYLSIRTSTMKAVFCGRFDKAVMSGMFKYSLPLCVNSVSYWLLTSFNRTIVNVVYGDSVSGLFAIGSKFGMLINLVTTCFTLAWQDLSFSAENEMDAHEKGRFYSKACNSYGLVLGVGMMLLLPVVKLMFPILVHESYAESENTIPLFLGVAIISAISTFIGNVFYAIKDTKSIFYSMVAAAALNLAIGYPLIVKFGMNGANIAVVLGYTLNIAIRGIILKKKLRFSLSYKLPVMVAAIVICSMVFIYGNLIVNLIWLLPVLVGALLVFKKDIARIIRMITKRSQ